MKIMIVVRKSDVIVLLIWLDFEVCFKRLDIIKGVVVFFGVLKCLFS